MSAIVKEIQNYDIIMQKYNNLELNYKDLQKKNQLLKFYAQSRDQTIDTLLNELAIKETKSNYIKDPDGAKIKQMWFKCHEKLLKSKTLIDRYIGIINELYNTVTQLTGVQMDLKHIEQMKEESFNILHSEEHAKPNLNSLIKDFKFRNNCGNVNDSKLTRKIDTSQIDVNSQEFKQKKIMKYILRQQKKELKCENKKQVIIEFNELYQDIVVKVICEKILNKCESRATFCNLNEIEMDKVKKLQKNYQLFGKLQEPRDQFLRYVLDYNLFNLTVNKIIYNIIIQFHYNLLCISLYNLLCI